jgi:hypothetical protein
MAYGKMSSNINPGRFDEAILSVAQENSSTDLTQSKEAKAK